MPSARICVGPIEHKSGREWPAELAQTSERPLAAPVAAYFELFRTRHANLDLIALFKLKSVDDGLAGRRTAKLLPHFAICIRASLDIHYDCISII